jgi:fatty acid desaturase
MANLTRSRLEFIHTRLESLASQRGRMTPDQIQEWEALWAEYEQAVAEWRRQRRTGLGFMIALLLCCVLFLYEIFIGVVWWYFILTWLVLIYCLVRIMALVTLMDKEARS